MDRSPQSVDSVRACIYTMDNTEVSSLALMYQIVNCDNVVQSSSIVAASFCDDWSIVAVGRGRSNDLVIHDRFVSRKHCMLQYESSSAVKLINYSRKTPLIVNRKVLPEAEVILAVDDSFVIKGKGDRDHLITLISKPSRKRHGSDMGAYCKKMRLEFDQYKKHCSKLWDQYDKRLNSLKGKTKTIENEFLTARPQAFYNQELVAHKVSTESVDKDGAILAFESSAYESEKESNQLTYSVSCSTPYQNQLESTTSNNIVGSEEIHDEQAEIELSTASSIIELSREKYVYNAAPSNIVGSEEIHDEQAEIEQSTATSIVEEKGVSKAAPPNIGVSDEKPNAFPAASTIAEPFLEKEKQIERTLSPTASFVSGAKEAWAEIRPEILLKDEEPTTAQLEAEYAIGSRVLGRFEGGRHWYEGIVAAYHPDNTFDIQYDDGDKETHVCRMYILEDSVFEAKLCSSRRRQITSCITQLYGLCHVMTREWKLLVEALLGPSSGLEVLSNKVLNPTKKNRFDLHVLLEWLLCRRHVKVPLLSRSETSGQARRLRSNGPANVLKFKRSECFTKDRYDMGNLDDKMVERMKEWLVDEKRLERGNFKMNGDELSELFFRSVLQVVVAVLNDRTLRLAREFLVSKF